jgi:hypothetical protein
MGIHSTPGVLALITRAGCLRIQGKSRTEDSFSTTIPIARIVRAGILKIIDKPIADFKDHMVLIKGILVRADQGTRINLTALESIAKSCPQ